MQKMTTTNEQNQPFTDNGSKELLTLWVLRILIKLRASHKFYDNDYYIREDDIAYFLGLGKYVDYKEGFDRSTIGKRLKEMHTKAERKSREAMLPVVLQKNVKKLQKLVGLNEVETTLLAFKVMLASNKVLDTTVNLLGDLSTREVFHVLSVILQIPQEKVAEAFSLKGRLSGSGLMLIDNTWPNNLNRKIDLLSDKFGDMLISSNDDVFEFIKDSVRSCSGPTLTLEDYGHIDKELSILKPYLTSVMHAKSPGSNVLVYGRPGTGKTELVKVLARHLGVELYEVSYADEDDDPIDGKKRLNALKVCQSFFAKEKILLMFDEAEDVFSSNDLSAMFGIKQQNHKAWMHRMLEENSVPTIWLTNSIHSMDSATLRRFDMVFELPIPPKKQRESIVAKLFNGLPQETVRKLAQNDKLAPALLSRSADVLAKIRESVDDPVMAVETLIEGTLKAQGHGSIQKDNESSLPGHYDPNFIHTTTDLVELASGLKETHSGRLCLYGPPGTGKSAFGKWIAEELDRPFLLKKGSDLLGMYVGQTEQNIANAFKEASEEGAVLVFDEVDSFLRDRRGATHSWETTQVNEMLVQMENFEGVFIATTNLIDGLDQAALRRFDLKMEFGYLQPEQAVRLLMAECATLGIKSAKKDLETIKRITNLTPGDFAATRRQHRFNPIRNISDLLERVQYECRLKNDGSSKKMGFNP